MKIYSGYDYFCGNILFRESFKIISINKKIIEEYETTGDFVWKIFLGQVSQDFRNPDGIYYMHYDKQLLDDKPSLWVCYNPRKLNLQMLIDFIRKIGIVVELEYEGEHDIKFRKIRESLFLEPENLSEIKKSYLISSSLFKITSKNYLNQYYLSSLAEQMQPDYNDNNKEFSDKGINALVIWNDFRHIVCAEYFENKCTEQDIIKYFKKKFNIEINSTLG